MMNRSAVELGDEQILLIVEVLSRLSDGPRMVAPVSKLSVPFPEILAPAAIAGPDTVT
jgi:hypothetical protein